MVPTRQITSEKNKGINLTSQFHKDSLTSDYLTHTNRPPIQAVKKKAKYNIMYLQMTYYTLKENDSGFVFFQGLFFKTTAHF